MDEPARNATATKVGCGSVVGYVFLGVFLFGLFSRLTEEGPPPRVVRPAAQSAEPVDESDPKSAKAVVAATAKMERFFDAVPGASNFVTTCNVGVGDGRFNVYVSDAFFRLTDTQRRELMQSVATLWRDTKYVREFGYSRRVTFWGRTEGEPWFQDVDESRAAPAEPAPNPSPSREPDLTPGQRAWAKWSKDQEAAEKAKDDARKAAAARPEPPVDSIAVLSFGRVSGPPEAFVRLLPSKRTMYVKVGQRVAGWTITAIDRKALTVTATDPQGETRAFRKGG